VMKARILDINPQAKIEAFQEYCGEKSAARLLGQDIPGGLGISYVVDAIDTVSSKIDLIMRASSMDIPVISCMGAGNKLDPTKLEIADIYDTSVCPLARVMRRELRKRGLAALDVVYSKETPIKVDEAENPCRSGCICPKKDRTCLGRRSIPGSVSFVPSVAGLIIASHVVRKLVGA